MVFDAFVQGGTHEAETFFEIKGKPVHCLHPHRRRELPRVDADGLRVRGFKGVLSHLQPDHYNKFTKKREGVRVAALCPHI